MKTLIILSVILGIFTVYFIFNAEKSISVKNLLGIKQGAENAIPAGTDIAKFILNKANTIIPKITDDIIPNIENKKLSELTDEVKSKVGDIKDKILEGTFNLIKEPVKDKLTGIFCPQK